MPLINSNINFLLAWSANCGLFSSVAARTFTITNTKINALVVTLSADDNAKVLKQLGSRFKSIIT